MQGPAIERQLGRPGVRKPPAPGHRPDGEAEQAAERQREQQPETSPGGDADPDPGAAPGSAGQPGPGHPAERALGPAPQADRQGDQNQLQAGAGGRLVTHAEVGIVEPAQHQRCQRRRRGRAEHDRHVDDREGIGEDRIDRQPDLWIDQRQHDLEPGLHRPVAEGARDPQVGVGARLAERAEGHQHQERGLLEGQPESERQTQMVLDQRHVRRVLPAGRRRDQAREPARGGDQEGKADRGREMRHREQRGHRALDPDQPHGAMAGGEHQQGQPERQHGRQDATGQGQTERGPDPGGCGQLAPGLERKPLAAEHRQVAEGREHGAEQPGHDRSEEDQQGDRGQIAKQGGRTAGSSCWG